MTLKALLFDVDGTLADTEAEGHLPAFNEAFRHFGLDWHWSGPLYHDLLSVSGGRERIAYYIERYCPDAGAYRAQSEAARAAWVATIHEQKTRCFRQRLEAGRVTLRPGIARLISQACEAGLKIGIVTNASRPTLEPLLQHVLGGRLSSCIAAAITGDLVAHKKPAPDLYRRGCQAIDCLPQECVAIEDSGIGLKAAAAAGIPTLVTVNDDTDMEQLAAAGTVVDSLGEPGRPARILKSPGFAFEYVDLAVIRRLHEAHVAASPASSVGVRSER